jgi:transposase
MPAVPGPGCLRVDLGLETLMMVVGVDPHKQAHTAVAADELGRKKASKTVRARRDGHRELIAWARELAPAGRLWAVEDVRHVAGGLIRELLAAGEQVVFVPPKLMAGERRGGRERGKSGPIDALAIARLALREGAPACPPPASMSRCWRCGG